MRKIAALLAGAFLLLAPAAFAQGTIGSNGISGGAPPGADPAAMLFNRPLDLGTGALTANGGINTTGAASLTGGGTLGGAFGGALNLTDTTNGNGILSLGSPRIYNAGQTVTPGGIAATVASTYGAFSPAVGQALIVNCPTCLPEVSGFTTPSAVANSLGRDSVSLFISNSTRAPYLTLSSPTYDTTHVYPATDLTPTQVAGVRIGAFIETNDSPKYTGTITAVAANGSSITVSGWFQTGNTGSGQVPAGTAAYVDVVTSIWAINTNCNVSDSYTNVIGTTCQENDIYSTYGSLTTPILTNPNSDVPNLNSYSAVCGASTGCGAAFFTGGTWHRGFLVEAVDSTGAAYVSGQTSGDLLVAQQNNTTNAFTFEARAEGILNLGKQSGTGGTTPALNFYSSGSGVVDAGVTAAGGSSTAYNGVLRATASYLQVYGPNGASGDAVNIQGLASGSGGIISIASPSTNSPVSVKSKGSGDVFVMGSSSGNNNVVAEFVPTTLTTGSNNYFVLNSETATAPILTVSGVSAPNEGLTVEQSGTGTLTLGNGSGDILNGNGSALATAATTGFLHLPFTTAAPTGTPATIDGNACEINTATETLNCYIGTGWYHVALTSGAG